MLRRKKQKKGAKNAMNEVNRRSGSSEEKRENLWDSLRPLRLRGSNTLGVNHQSCDERNEPINFIKRSLTWTGEIVGRPREGSEPRFTLT